MRKLLVAVALAAVAAPAHTHAEPASAIETLPMPLSQQGGDQHDRGERGPRRPRLFISPSGEPFRGGDGLAAWFAQADADHDGSITPDEFQADALRAFKLYDSNGDGVIDGFEIQTYERERVPEISEIIVPGDERSGLGGESGRRAGGHHGGMGGGRHGDQSEGGGEQQTAQRTPAAGREGAARFSLLNEPEPLLAADEDVDGKVTKAEWTRATARRFAKLDRAHAGRLTMADLRPQKPTR